MCACVCVCACVCLCEKEGERPRRIAKDQCLRSVSASTTVSDQSTECVSVAHTYTHTHTHSLCALRNEKEGERMGEREGHVLGLSVFSL